MEANKEHDLFVQAVAVVRSGRKASVVLLQRRLNLGYGRAKELIDRMEAEGIVGPKRENSTDRQVLPYHDDAKAVVEARENPLRPVVGIAAWGATADHQNRPDLFEHDDSLTLHFPCSSCVHASGDVAHCFGCRHYA